MVQTTYQLFSDKVIIRLRGKICENSDELITSCLYRDVLIDFIEELNRRQSVYLNIFPERNISSENIDQLITTLHFLVKLPSELVVKGQ